MRSAPWESKTPTDVQSAVASPVTIASGRFDLFAKPSANDRCFSKRTTAVGRRSLQETQDATGGRADADPQGTRLVLPFRKISVTDSRSDWQVVGIRGEGWSPTPADPHRAGVAHAARLGSSRCQEGASGCARWASRAPRRSARSRSFGRREFESIARPDGGPTMRGRALPSSVGFLQASQDPMVCLRSSPLSARFPRQGPTLSGVASRGPCISQLRALTGLAGSSPRVATQWPRKAATWRAIARSVA